MSSRASGWALACLASQAPALSRNNAALDAVVADVRLRDRVSEVPQEYERGLQMPETVIEEARDLRRLREVHDQRWFDKHETTNAERV
jgi:hypothetical protein